MLVLDRNTRIAECTDGTSNTIIVGEESDFLNVPTVVSVKAGKKEGQGLSIFDHPIGIAISPAIRIITHPRVSTP